MELLESDGHPVTILTASAKDDAVFIGECEDTLDTPRNDRMGMEPPGVALDSSASGHRAVALRRARPAWMIQPDIQQPGRYQLMVRARGTLVGAAYPSLGIVLGENASDSGSVRLVSSSWHQVPVGLPVQLGKGPQWIGVALANEFIYRNQTQRAADIDRFELRRVPIPPAKKARHPLRADSRLPSRLSSMARRSTGAVKSVPCWAVRL
jgi:hypothetical protein